jgi:hypothetical protein
MPILAWLGQLDRKIAALESQPSSGFPKRIALRAEKNGKLLCVDDGDQLVANREQAGAWETFTIEGIE